jgi:hypothetical protein
MCDTAMAYLLEIREDELRSGSMGQKIIKLLLRYLLKLFS